MATATEPRPAEGEADAPIPLGRVKAELCRQASVLQGDAPIRFARMSNLVVYCGSRAEADKVHALIPRIVDHHPARVMLLEAARAEAHADVSATVRVRRLGGGRSSVLSEQITLRAGGRGVDQLPFAVRALSVGDLPTNLWWASAEPPPLAGPILRDLADPAEQVVYDSLGWRDPHHGVAATSPWLGSIERDGAGRWRVASDINWRRLKTWRRVLVQGLDPVAAPGLLDEATEVLIEHGPHAVTQAWHLASWLASRLCWSYRANKLRPGHEIAFQFLAAHGPVRLRIDRLAEGPAEVTRVRVARGFEGQGGGVEFASDGEGRLAILPIGGPPCSDRTIAGRDQDLAELIGRQLSDREPDPVFRESMKVAHVLAQHVPFH